MSQKVLINEILSMMIIEINRKTYTLFEYLIFHHQRRKKSNPKCPKITYMSSEEKKLSIYIFFFGSLSTLFFTCLIPVKHFVNSLSTGLFPLCLFHSFSLFPHFSLYIDKLSSHSADQPLFWTCFFLKNKKFHYKTTILYNSFWLINNFESVIFYQYGG